MNLNFRIESLKLSHKDAFFRSFYSEKQIKGTGTCLRAEGALKFWKKTSNNWNLTHTTPGKIGIGTIVLRIILWFCYPNVSQMCLRV